MLQLMLQMSSITIADDWLEKRKSEKAKRGRGTDVSGCIKVRRTNFEKVYTNTEYTPVRLRVAWGFEMQLCGQAASFESLARRELGQAWPIVSRIARMRLLCMSIRGISPPTLMLCLVKA